ncbi:hypothetical protein NKH18_51435 [Streptomyces sp. M10(2022)]
MELLNVTPLGTGPWHSWKPNPNVSRKLSTKHWPRIKHGDHEEVAVWLLDEHGKQVRQLPEEVRVEIRFRDYEGKWWASDTGGTTARIARPTTDRDGDPFHQGGGIGRSSLPPGSAATTGVRWTSSPPPARTPARTRAQSGSLRELRAKRKPLR